MPGKNGNQGCIHIYVYVVWLYIYICIYSVEQVKYRVARLTNGHDCQINRLIELRGMGYNVFIVEGFSMRFYICYWLQPFVHIVVMARININVSFSYRDCFVLSRVFIYSASIKFLM